MGIDILFIVMAAYGFYFGYMYGLIKVVMFMGALFGALVVAMYATPSAAQLIQTTLEVDSAILPFVAFIVTLIGVMLVSRIVIKLLEENVKNKQVNQATQAVGGFIMSGIFIFLFSVLVTFFSAAHVIHPEKTRTASFFYKYIEKIPVHGTDLLKLAMPYMDSFVDYMKDAMERLETGKKKPVNPHLDDLEHTYTVDSSAIELDSMQLDSINLINPRIDSTGEDAEEDDTDTLPEMVIKVQIDTSALNKKKTNSKNNSTKGTGTSKQEPTNNKGNGADSKQGTGSNTKTSGENKSGNTTKSTNGSKPEATNNVKGTGTSKQVPTENKQGAVVPKTTPTTKGATSTKVEPTSNKQGTGSTTKATSTSKQTPANVKQGTTPPKTTTTTKGSTANTKGGTSTKEEAVGSKQGAGSGAKSAGNK